jgi:hypothetical protein
VTAHPPGKGKLKKKRSKKRYWRCDRREAVARGWNNEVVSGWRRRPLAICHLPSQG